MSCATHGTSIARCSRPKTPRPKWKWKDWVGSMADTLEWQTSTFMTELERRSGTPVSACFQCHKCSTGCPIGPEMDLLSSQVMRMLRLGQERAVLESEGIWLCASCAACTTRCPMQ